MTVSSTSAISGPYTPNGSTTQFSFGFKAASASEVAVILMDGDDAAEVSSALYSVSLSTVGDGGTVTFTVAPAAGNGDLYIVSAPDFTQQQAFGAEGPFTPSSLNALFDRAAVRDILLKHETERAAKWPQGATAYDFGSVTDGQVVALVGGKLEGIDNTGGSTEAAAASAATALVSRDEAEDFADDAEAFATSAATAQGLAESAQAAAEAAVSDAEDARDDAETAAAAALLGPERIYASTAAGLAAVANTEYFYVQTGTNGDLQLYHDNAGALATDTFIAPSRATVETAAAGHLRFTSPFVEDVPSNSYFRSVIEDFYVEGGQPGHEYLVNLETLNLGGGNGRVTIRLRNKTLGIDIAQWQKLDTQANINARTSPFVFGYQNALVGYRGTTFSGRINWDAITNWAFSLTTNTTMAQSGLRADRTMTWDRIGVFKERAEPKIRLTVGAGTETDTHFNSFADAIASLYIPGVTITRSTYPNSDICSFSNQVLIECIDDGYAEEVTSTTILSVDQSTIVLPPFVTLRGRGDTRLFMNAGSNTAPVIEAPFSFRLEHMTIEQQGPGYEVHIDNNNALAKRATTGPAVLSYRLISVMYRVTFEGSADQLSWGIGCGISNGHTIRMERCRGLLATGLPFLGVHTSDNTTDPGEVEVLDSYVNDDTITSATGMQLTKIDAMTVKHKVLVRNTDMAGFSVGNSVDATPGFIREGKIDPDITVGGTLDT